MPWCTDSEARCFGGAVRIGTFELRFVTVVSACYRVQITVASILEGSTYWERAVLDLSVYFADENYTSHPDWNAAWLSALTDDVWTNNNETAQSSTHAYLQEIGLQGVLHFACDVCTHVLTMTTRSAYLLQSHSRLFPSTRKMPHKHKSTSGRCLRG